MNGDPIRCPCCRTTLEIVKSSSRGIVGFKQTEPSLEQVAALQAYAATHGRTWKQSLLDAWMNGADAREPKGYLLRQLRNRFGPSWLVNYQLPTTPLDRLVDATLGVAIASAVLAAYQEQSEPVSESDLDNEQPMTLSVRLTLGVLRKLAGG